MGVNAELAPMMPGARTQQHNAASPGLVLLILVLAAMCASLMAVAFVVAPPGPAIGIGPSSLSEPVRIAAGITVLILAAFVCTANQVTTRAGVVDSVSDASIVAAMVLGGPAAAALVAVLGSIELREFRGVPWYGVVANHSGLGVAAVAGGSVTVAIAAAVPGSEGLLAAGFAGGLTYLLAANATALALVAVRDHASRAWFAAAIREQLGASRVGTIALGVLMAAAWLLSPLSLLLFAVPLYALHAALDEARRALEAEAMWRNLRQDRPSATGHLRRVWSPEPLGGRRWPDARVTGGGTHLDTVNASRDDQSDSRRQERGRNRRDDAEDGVRLGGVADGPNRGTHVALAAPAEARSHVPLVATLGCVIP